MSAISFFVPGVPRPGGSKKGFLNKKSGRVMIVDACAKNKEWRSLVSLFAYQAYTGEPLEGPLELKVSFTLPRPKHHYNSKGILKPAAPMYHISAPDTTKLLRSTEDSLKGIIWKDDNQVALQYARKIYGEKPGAHITVSVII